VKIALDPSLNSWLKPLLLAGCGARPEAEQRLSPLRTLGGVINSKSATTPPKHAERGSGVE